ncbi:MAG: helix-turn-helix transcriptional regulator [Bacteroidota bacterium]
MNIGKAIKELRKKKGISQIDFAKSCDITQTSLSLIETGTKRPSPATLKKICLVLEIPEMYLYLLSADESDVPANKKHLFKILFPNIETMVKQLWVEGGIN